MATELQKPQFKKVDVPRFQIDIVNINNQTLPVYGEAYPD
jgi:hypothetical protein